MAKPQIATLGGGCFWCLEAAYQEIRGIESVVSGYAGGQTPDPSYEQVCNGTTGHAEVVQLRFDPATIVYSDILDIFWAIHNPTTPGRQGNDVGPQYRSIILYGSPEQEREAKESKKAVQELWADPVLTEIVSLEAFYPAEDYHQNYFRNHPNQAYCQAVINPKLVHLRQTFKKYLK